MNDIERVKKLRRNLSLSCQNLNGKVEKIYSKHGKQPTGNAESICYRPTSLHKTAFRSALFFFCSTLDVYLFSYAFHSRPRSRRKYHLVDNTSKISCDLYKHVQQSKRVSIALIHPVCHSFSFFLIVFSLSLFLVIVQVSNKSSSVPSTRAPPEHLSQTRMHPLQYLITDSCVD